MLLSVSVIGRRSLSRASATTMNSVPRISRLTMAAPSACCCAARQQRTMSPFTTWTALRQATKEPASRQPAKLARQTPEPEAEKKTADTTATAAPQPLSAKLTETLSSKLPASMRPLPPNQPVEVHEDIYTIPNILTFTRLAAAPVIGYLVLKDQHALAAALFAYAGVTDLLDGWIARRWNRRTVVGTVIDPMADKALMTILTVCLAIKGALPVWLAVIILGRDAGLGIAAIYYRWISLPPPKTFARYWDFSLPSAEVRPTTISKYNTLFQIGLIGLTTAAPVIGADLGAALSTMQYLVAATTIWSGASYVYTKDAVKILNQAENKPK